jgi:hypothetical protein
MQNRVKMDIPWPVAVSSIVHATLALARSYGLILMLAVFSFVITAIGVGCGSFRRKLSRDLRSQIE